MIKSSNSNKTVTSNYNDIICFGYNDWGEIPKSTQMHMSNFSKNNQFTNILYINSEIWISDLIRNLWGKMFQKDNILNAIFQKITKIDSKIMIYTPIHYIPLARSYKYLFKIDKFLTLFFLKRIMNSRKLENVIFFINRPLDIDTYSNFISRGMLKCFWWSDDWSEFNQGKLKNSVFLKEKTLKNCFHYVSKSDVVFVVSERLFNLAKAKNKEVYIIPNATNYELFSKVALPETEIASEVKNISKPILGYIGLLNDRIAYDYIEACLYKHPEWNFIFLGPATDSHSPPKSIIDSKNCYFIGAKSQKRLPNYMRVFDVCLIPHKLNKAVLAMNPIKIYEYLATGKSIVTTNVPGVEKFKYLIKIAENKEQFIQYIEESLNEKNEELRYKRQEVAKLNSWEIRSDSMLRIMNNRMNTIKTS